MAIAASLWFDPSLEGEVRALWGEMARRGICEALHIGPYRPHVTLGVWEPFEHLSLARDLQVAAATIPPLEIVLGAVGGFSGEGVVYLQPGITPELMRVRQRVLELAAGLGARPASWYPHGAWFPHCTIGWGLDRQGFREATDFLLGKRLPLNGFAVAIGVIDTPAEVELGRISLAGGTR